MKKRILISGVLALSIVLLFACGQEDHGNAEVTKIPEISQNEIEEEKEEASGELLEEPEEKKRPWENGTRESVPPKEGYEVMLLAEEERELFLAYYGFLEEEPYHTYYDEQGRLQLEMWLDEDHWYGGGIRYVHYPDSEGEVSLESFVFYEVNRNFERDYGNESDPYDWEEELTVIQHSVDGEWVLEYEENSEYNEAGKLSGYIVTGMTDFYGEGPEERTLLDREYTYRDDGSLLFCLRYRSDMIFGTWGHTKRSWYDEKEREVYSTQYVTHGSLEDYYIYDGENELPFCVLTLDNNGGYYIPYFSFFVSEENVNVPDYDAFFEDSSYDSCVVFYHPEDGRYDIYNKDGDIGQCFERNPPFDTFHIPAVVMGMQNGLLDDVDKTNSKYYKKLMDTLGKDEIRNGLVELEYGNRIVTEEDFDETFYYLRISPMEQVEFFTRLFEGETELSEEELQTLRDLMYVGEIEGYSLYGTAAAGKWEDSWFVGFYEKGGERTYFAIYLGQHSEKNAKDTLISILSAT